MKKLLISVIGLAALFCAGAESELIPNGNFDAAAQDGKVPGWNATGAVLVPGFSGQALQVKTDTAAGKQFKTTTSCPLPKLSAGKYVFSGLFKGDAAALWMVIQFNNNPKNAPFQIWLDKSKFSVPDKAGWRRFVYSVEAPAGTVRGTLYIEPFAMASGTAVEFDEIKLTSAND